MGLARSLTPHAVPAPAPQFHPARRACPCSVCPQEVFHGGVAADKLPCAPQRCEGLKADIYQAINGATVADGGSGPAEELKEEL